MIPREVAESDPETAILADKPDALKMWFGDDRRVVMYPCNNNADLNFVLIHPDNESHATWSKSEQFVFVFYVCNPLCSMELLISFFRLEQSRLCRAVP